VSNPRSLILDFLNAWLGDLTILVPTGSRLIVLCGGRGADTKPAACVIQVSGSLLLLRVRGRSDTCTRLQRVLMVVAT